MNLVVDANVVLCWYLLSPQRKQEYAKGVLRALLERDLQIAVPQTWDVEVGAVLLKRSRQKGEGALRPDGLNQAVLSLATFEVHVGGAVRYGCSGYDALYLHTALKLNCPLATLDGGLIAACKRAGVEVFQP